MREGEISPDEHNQPKQQLKRQRDIIPILVVGFHALLSIFLLFAFVATAELFTPTESVEMLGFSFLVIGVYNSFMLLHTRFGLRERFLGSFGTMPVELNLCYCSVRGCVERRPDPWSGDTGGYAGCTVSNLWLGILIQ